MQLFGNVDRRQIPEYRIKSKIDMINTHLFLRMVSDRLRCTRAFVAFQGNKDFERGTSQAGWLKQVFALKGYQKMDLSGIYI